MNNNNNAKAFKRLSNEAYAKLSTGDKIQYLRSEQEALRAGRVIEPPEPPAKSGER